MIKELRDSYSAEKQMIKALPKMAKAANSEALRDAFNEHSEVTKEQAKRLESIFETLDVSSQRPEVRGHGRIGRGRQRDDGRGCFASGNGRGFDWRRHSALNITKLPGMAWSRTFARLLGHGQVADLLQETLDEEGEADKTLTELAESEINVEAAAGAEGGD